MIILLGNPKPHHVKDGERIPLPGPVQHEIEIPPGQYSLEPGADVRDLTQHLFRNRTVTKLPDHELFVHVVASASPEVGFLGGAWGSGNHGSEDPTWVSCIAQTAEEVDQAAELERLLSEFWECPRGVPDDVEDTHHTFNGPPGVGPAPVIEPEEG